MKKSGEKSSGYQKLLDLLSYSIASGIPSGIDNCQVLKYQLAET